MKRREVLLKAPSAMLGAATAVWLMSSLSAQAQEDAAAKTIADKLLAGAPSIGERSMGQPDAPVVMIEYASATCPHCAEFHEKVLPQIRGEYIETGKLRFIFREFPLDNLAMGAFMLTRCVPEDKFFPTLNVLFKRQKLWMSGNAKEELFRVMQLAGMDQAAFDACLKKEDLAKAIYESAKQAREEFGVKGTPAIFINGRMIDGHKEYAEIKSAIDAELAK